MARSYVGRVRRRAGMEKLSAGGGGEGRRSRCLVLAHVVECRPRLGRLLVVLWAADVEPKAAEVVNPDRLARVEQRLDQVGEVEGPVSGITIDTPSIARISTRHRGCLLDESTSGRPQVDRGDR